MDNKDKIISKIIRQIENDNRLHKIEDVYINKPAEFQDLKNVDVNQLEMDKIKDLISNGKSSNGIIQDRKKHNEPAPRSYPAKRVIVRLILDTFLGDYLYFEKGGFSKLELIESKLYTSSDTNKCEDLIISSINGIPFRCSDVNASMFLPSSTLYEFDFGKTFENDVVLKKSYINPPAGCQRYKSLNNKFNSMFKIYAWTKYDSLLVLTPHIMEYLISLNEKYNRKLEVSFINKKLYIKFNSYNLFKMSKSTTNISEEKIRHFATQLEELHTLIEYLKEVLLIKT